MLNIPFGQEFGQKNEIFLLNSVGYIEVWRWQMEDKWIEISSKQVHDVDGFLTDYTMYKESGQEKYVFVFGDKEVYSPENSDFDWECETEAEAKEWFESYNGFGDEFVQNITNDFKLYLFETLEDDSIPAIAVEYENGYITIEEGAEGYNYSVVTKGFELVDGGVLYNTDISIVGALGEIIKDIGDIDYSKLKIVEFESIEEQIRAAEEESLKGPEVYSSRIVVEYKIETQQKFLRINDQEPEDIEEMISNYIQNIIDKYGLEAEIVGLAITGSRARGIEKPDSDLDIVVELKTKEKEDALFNLFNESDYYISGVKVDINPITRYQTGSLEQYLIEADKFFERKVAEMENGYELYCAVRRGNVVKVKELLRSGADVNYVYRPKEYGFTPLHMAAYYAMNDMIELLIENGANINAYSLEGKTPLALAIERHNREETLSILLKNGALDGTAPMPDYAKVGDVFLTCDNLYFLIVEDGSIQEYSKSELEKVINVRKQLEIFGKEVEIKFANEEQWKKGFYYDFDFSDTCQEDVENRDEQLEALATDIEDYLERYDPIFGYAEGLDGQENRDQWIDTIKEDIIGNRTDWIDWIKSHYSRSAELGQEEKSEAEKVLKKLEEYEHLHVKEDTPVNAYKPNRGEECCSMNNRHRGR